MPSNNKIDVNKFLTTIYNTNLNEFMVPVSDEMGMGHIIYEGRTIYRKDLTNLTSEGDFLSQFRDVLFHLGTSQPSNISVDPNLFLSSLEPLYNFYLKNKGSHLSRKLETVFRSTDLMLETDYFSTKLSKNEIYREEFSRGVRGGNPINVKKSEQSYNNYQGKKLLDIESHPKQNEQKFSEGIHEKIVPEEGYEFDSSSGFVRRIEEKDVSWSENKFYSDVGLDGPQKWGEGLRNKDGLLNKKGKGYIKVAIILSIMLIGAYYVTTTSILSDFSGFIQTQIAVISSTLSSLGKVENIDSSKPPIITFVSNDTATTGRYKNYQLGLIKAPGGVEVNSYGDFIVLINNKDAKNPTYTQLTSFLKSDKTDQYPYQFVTTNLGSYSGSAENYVDLVTLKNIIDGTKQPNSPRICADFAELLHNNAERAGIRCAFVSINVGGSGHALNAFDTTDGGLVYIDDTGYLGSLGPSSCDKIIDVLKVGNSYIPRSLFPEPGWSTTWENAGTVTSIYMTWDGNWNN
jgi:hypothetical protein